MADIATDSRPPPDGTYAAFPLWYKIMVCLGSAAVGGVFGTSHEVMGVVFGAVGGVGVAVLWLIWVGKLQMRPTDIRFFGGIGFGILAGVLDTFWLHLTAWGLGYQTLERYSDPNFFIIDIGTALFVGSILGVIAGAIYGLVCMIVLEVHLAYIRREQE